LITLLTYFDQVCQSSLELLSNVLYHETEPVEPSVDLFLDVIRSLLDRPDTLDETHHVALLVFICAINR